MTGSVHGARLVLVRHGRSAHVQRGWVTADGFRQWRAAYEAAGIQPDDAPPASLLALVASASIIVASDARRAVESAARLRTGEHPHTPLLRELDLAVADVSTVRLPMAVWALVVGGRMAMASMRGLHPPAAERARISAAADWLETLATTHACIVAVTHAAFRAQLARECRRRGWCRDGATRSMSHWSAWQLVRTPVGAAP